MTEIKTGSCHCGEIEFQVILNNRLENIRRCNCSLCSRKGAIMASVPLNSLMVTKGKEFLSLYQWNTKTAEHYFCRICGIYTYHRRRSNPNEYGFNVACFDDIDLSEFEQIPIGDGRSMSLVD